MRRPLGVSLISFFYVFGAVVLLFSVVFYNADANSISIAERFGLPNVAERLMRVGVASFSLLMVYGYFRLKKWGFWIMIAYSITFGLISSSLITNQLYQPYLGNLIFSIIVVTYTIYVKESYFKSVLQQ
ncbi:hypothetical protein ACTSEZ_07530 [Metabacillus sp. JX24]|uniref:hypothetical protein n=1 Tax=Metabacillus sp. JX24 TaxID=3240759 RepID=UPI003510B74F